MLSIYYLSIAPRRFLVVLFYIYIVKIKYIIYFIMKNRSTKILLVDDEPDILEIVGYNLAQEGYRISTATNGKEDRKAHV